jgi:hypothetical protein
MEGKRCYYTRSNVLTTSPAPIRSRHSDSMEGKRCYYTRSNVLGLYLLSTLKISAYHIHHLISSHEHHITFQDQDLLTLPEKLRSPAAIYGVLVVQYLFV